MGQPNYRSVKVPEGKKPTEYTTHERRAEVLQVIEEAGHPDAVNQAELARRYEVNRSTVHRDFKRLREFVLDEIDEERVDTISQLGYQKVIKGLIEQEDFGKAARALDSWNGWLFDRGKVDKEPDKVEADVDVRKRETKVYAGVDLSDMPGIDPDRTVGARFETDDEDETESAAPMTNGVDIPLPEDERESEGEGDE